MHSRRIPAHEGLNDRAKLEHRPSYSVKPRRQAGLSRVPPRRWSGRPRVIQRERREFAANVVPDDDLPRFKPFGELLRDVVMQGGASACFLRRQQR